MMTNPADIQHKRFAKPQMHLPELPTYSTDKVQTHWGQTICMQIVVFSWNFIGVCAQGSIWWYINISSDNGLAPSRRQAIIWTNDGLIRLYIYASVDLDEPNESISKCEYFFYINI